MTGEAGAMAVGELSDGRPSGAGRTAGHIRRSDPELFKVDVLARGHGVIEQGRREAHLRTGDLALTVAPARKRDEARAVVGRAWSSSSSPVAIDIAGHSGAPSVGDARITAAP